VIEAFKLERRHLNWPQWAHDALSENKIITHNIGKFYNAGEETYLIIETIEGNMRANLGDYIVKGIRGELYPCKSDIFLESYEAVE
jgi:hypothetical protein